MQDGLDHGQLGLLQAPVRELSGFIYISLSDDPPEFDAAAAACIFVKPQGLDRAGGEDRRLRRRGQLENRLGKQSRMLPLQRQPSAIHQSKL